MLRGCSQQRILRREKEVHQMIVIDRTRCVGCGHCNAMVTTFKCIQANSEYELYEEPPRQDRDYVLRIMRECMAHCIYLSGGDWDD